MNELTVSESYIPAMSDRSIELVRSLETALRKCEQAELTTHHVLHGGLYARTITLPAGGVLTGVLITVPTMLVVDGDVLVSTDDTTLHLRGYQVIAASAHRKTAFLAQAETHLTMLFATSARSIAQAETEFTHEPELLMSRQRDARNVITITQE